MGKCGKSAMNDMSDRVHSYQKKGSPIIYVLSLLPQHNGHKGGCKARSLGKTWSARSSHGGHGNHMFWRQGYRFQ